MTLSRCSAEDHYQKLTKPPVQTINKWLRAVPAAHSKGPRAATFNLGLKRCHSRRVFSLHPQYSATLCCSVCIQAGIPADRAQTTERPARIRAANGISRIRSHHPWLQILGRQRRGVIVSVFSFVLPSDGFGCNSVYHRSSPTDSYPHFGATFQCKIIRTNLLGLILVLERRVHHKLAQI